jgi:hypothetical protein
MRQPFSKEERRQLLEMRREALRQYNTAMDQSDQELPWSEGESTASAEAEQYLAVAEKIEGDYFARLPRLVMSHCPIDGKPLIRSFDPYGFDGLWWRSDATPEEMPSCPHFCVMRGAVNINGQKSRGGDFQSYLGPEVPYVIPEILNKDGVVAVISQVEMTPGHLAYAIAYFAQRRPPVQELAANWPRPVFLYTTAVGEHRWRFDNCAWDFALQPWLERGKIRWCEPGDNSKLSEPPSPCPYVNLKGERQRMVVQGDRVWGIGLPGADV